MHVLLGEVSAIILFLDMFVNVSLLVNDADCYVIIGRLLDSTFSIQWEPQS